MNELNPRLASGWQLTRLDDACDVILGQSPPGETYNSEGEGLPFFQGKAEFGDCYPTPVKWCSAPTKVAQPDDVLISVRAPVGPTNLSPTKACIGRGLAALRPRNGMSSRYLLYAMRATVAALAEKATGSTFEAVSGATLRAHEIPVAPRDDQSRIVSEIEKQFTRLDAGVAALKRVQANLKRYRTAVLKAACEGRLVPTETEWPRKELAGAVRTMDQGWSPQCESQPSEGSATWAVIKTTAIQNLRFLEQENKALPADLRPREHLELLPGDLLITRAGPRSRVGVACLVRSTRPRLMLCDKAYRLRCKPDVALPAFIEVVLNAPHIVEQVNKLKTGISDSGVNLTQRRFGELVIPLPSVMEQAQVVAEVERRLSLVEELEATVTANLLRATRLRQSVLQSAFCPTPAMERS